MPNFTPNYDLGKPLNGEAYDIQVPNRNMDIIDTALKSLSDNQAFASEAEAIAGTNNTKGMTPLRTVQSINQRNKNFYATASGVNTLIFTLDRTVPSLSAGTTISFKNASANTGNVTATFLVGGVSTTKAILNNDGTQIAPGQSKANSLYTIVYDGTNFYLARGGGESSSSIEKSTSGEFIFNTTALNQNLTLPSSFDVNRSFIIINVRPEVDGSSSSVPSLFIRTRFTNATTVQFTTPSLTNANMKIRYQVVQLKEPNVVYSGLVNMLDTSNSVDITIPAVDLSKSYLIHNYYTSATNISTAIISGEFTSNTNIRFSRGTGTGLASISFFVVS